MIIYFCSEEILDFIKFDSEGNLYLHDPEFEYQMMQSEME